MGEINISNYLHLKNNYGSFSSITKDIQRFPRIRCVWGFLCFRKIHIHLLRIGIGGKSLSAGGLGSADQPYTAP